VQGDEITFPDIYFCKAKNVKVTLVLSAYKYLILYLKLNNFTGDMHASYTDGLKTYGYFLLYFR
jgi:hypothetical protein